MASVLYAYMASVVCIQISRVLTIHYENCICWVDNVNSKNSMLFYCLKCTMDEMHKISINKEYGLRNMNYIMEYGLREINHFRSCM